MDLEDLLLSGLPEAERQHVVDVIEQTTASKLCYKRSLSEPIIGGPDAKPAGGHGTLPVDADQEKH